MGRLGRVIAVISGLAGCAGSASDFEWVWTDYTPTAAPRKVDATVAIESTEIEAPGNEHTKTSGFFVPAQRRAIEDISNMFARTSSQRSGQEDYIVRVHFRWDGEVHPTLTLLEPYNGSVLATMSRPSSRQLRPVALNLQESMQLLKADLAAAFARLPAEIREPPPAHRDPL